MLLSKTILTLAASGALFGASPTVNQGAAAAVPSHVKVYATQETNVNSDEINKMIEAYVSKLNFNTQTAASQTKPTDIQPGKTAQQPTQTITKPAQTAP